MPLAQFSEDEFETNLLVELRDQYGPGFPHFKPSRRLERHLGFDFSVYTGFGLFGRRIGLFDDDPRLQTLLPQQRRAVLPHRHVNAFIQCKRPYLLTRSQNPTLQQMLQYFSGGPCFYFTIAQVQNDTLVDVQNRVQQAGLVRYASPCFSTFAQSDAAFAAGLVAQRTHFASPNSMVNHTIYGYTSPIRRGQGFSIPESNDGSMFLGELRLLLARQEPMPFCAHLVNTWKQLTTGVNQVVSVTDADWASAELALGDLEETPLDPLQLLGGETKGLLIDIMNERRQKRTRFPGDVVEPSLLSYAAVVMALRRFTRRELKSEWLVFVDPPLAKE